MKAALFDLDGVLVDTKKHHVAIYKQIAQEKYGVTLNKKVIEALGGVLKNEGAKIICKAVGIEPTDENAKKTIFNKG